MKQKIILITLPVLLLSSCSQTITFNDWSKTATEKLNLVNSKVEQQDYPFTTFTMVGTQKTSIGNIDINGVYTFKAEGNWWTDWDYKYKGTDIIPTRNYIFELYTAATYAAAVKGYVEDDKNEFTWIQLGSELKVSAVYRTTLLTKTRDTFVFNENGFVKSIERDEADGSNVYNIKFEYTK